MAAEDGEGGGALPSTADSSNRRRDRRRVEAKLKLQEQGDEGTTFADERTGKTVARGYARVLYGDHGAYVECRPDQVAWEEFEARTLDAQYYDLYRAFPPGRVQVYLQKRTVEDRPNPPKGRDSRPNNRSQGYADYRPGMVYISVKQVTVAHEGSQQVRTYRAPPKGRPHKELLLAALEKAPGVTVLDACVREVRWLRDKKHRRFTRVPAETLSRAAGVPEAACVKVTLWMAGERPAAVTLVERAAAVDLAAVERYCGSGGLRSAQDRQVEAAVGARINEVMLPVHPAVGAWPLGACPVLLSPAVASMPLVLLHALCGVAATTSPGALQECMGAVVWPVAEAGGGQGGGLGRRSAAPETPGEPGAAGPAPGEGPPRRAAAEARCWDGCAGWVQGVLGARRRDVPKLPT